STHMVWSSNRTAVAEMVMPRSQDTFSIVRYGPQNSRKLSRIEAVALRESYVGFQPDLSVAAAALDMDMYWLTWQTFVREEIVSQAAFAENNGHIAASRPTFASRTPRRAAARVALEAGAVAHEREIHALRAHLAFVAFGLGLGAARCCS